MINFKVHLIVIFSQSNYSAKIPEENAQGLGFYDKRENRDNHKRNKFSPKFINLGKTSKS